jgi:glycosyltransferase involved in cell wall biosynthesis
LKIAAVIPAYNEEERIAGVLRAVLKSPSIDEIIVVNDGSTDNTAQIAREFSRVRLVDIPVNCGKGGAMAEGVAATDAEILVFVDADLIGLRPEHVEALVAPLKAGKIKMTVGKFRGGRRLTDLSQRLAPNVSGQRAIRRDVYEQIPDLSESRYGVEMAITRFCRYYRVPTQTVWLYGVTHPMKEEKLGVMRGWASRARMYCEILKIMLDPRRPRRVRPRRAPAFPNLLRRLAANQHRNGHHNAAHWLYRQERRWNQRKQKRKIT